MSRYGHTYNAAFGLEASIALEQPGSWVEGALAGVGGVLAPAPQDVWPQSGPAHWNAIMFAS